MIYEFEGKRPKIGKGSYVAESALIIGDVTIGEKCFIAPGAVLRGDYGTIIIGDGTAIEDNVVVHARPGKTTRIGNHVTIGHYPYVSLLKIFIEWTPCAIYTMNHKY